LCASHFSGEDCSISHPTFTPPALQVSPHHVQQEHQQKHQQDESVSDPVLEKAFEQVLRGATPRPHIRQQQQQPLVELIQEGEGTGQQDHEDKQTNQDSAYVQMLRDALVADGKIDKNSMV
jgi:hypothetical protein